MRIDNSLLQGDGVEADFTELDIEEHITALQEVLRKTKTFGEAELIKELIDHTRQ